MELGSPGGPFDNDDFKFATEFGVSETTGLFGNYTSIYRFTPLAWGNKVYMIDGVNSNSYPFYRKAIVYDMDSGELSVVDTNFAGGGYASFPGSNEGRYHFITTGASGYQEGSNSLKKVDLQTMTMSTVANQPSVDMFRSLNRATWADDCIFYVTPGYSGSGASKVTRFPIYKFYPDTGVNTLLTTLEFTGNTLFSGEHLNGFTYAGDNIFYLTISCMWSDTKWDKITIVKFNAGTGEYSVIGECNEFNALVDGLYNSVSNVQGIGFANYSYFKEDKLYYRSTGVNLDNTRWAVYDFKTNKYTLLQANLNSSAKMPFGFWKTKDYIFGCNTFDSRQTLTEIKFK